MVKLLMGWNIIPGQESEYFEFFTQEFEPALSDLGLRATDMWLTAYGDWPQILTGIVAEDLETVRRILASDRWKRLKKRLLELVTDYQQKIIPASGGFQL
ncbi:MAG: hypothetical protein RML46_04840 [Anaerolineae bacterium]|nr:hypothetical protein [Anaerolineae bacterium]MDW8068220.1 hypothetical protein [Anaerolineae bacterium]